MNHAALTSSLGTTLTLGRGLVLCLALVSVACVQPSGGVGGGVGGGGTSGGGTSGGTSGGGGGIALDSLPAAWAAGMCGWFDRCGGGGAPISFSSIAVCTEALSTSGMNDVGSEIAHVKAGRMTYDGALASSCLAKLSTLPCGDFDSLEDSCGSVFAGNLDVGASCTDSDHCKAGWCKGLDEPQSDCPGTCAADKKADEACEDDDECEAGLGCVSGKCGTPTKPKVGEACEGTCEAGATCVWGQGQATCAKLPASGEACLSDDADQRCASGLRCLEGKCAASGKTGEACDFGESQDGSPECVAGLTCAMKLGDNGMPEKSMCTPAKKPGESCTMLFECKGIDQYCKGGTCTPLPKAGEACADKKDSPFIRCHLFSKCNKDDKCEAQADGKEGESCEERPCEEGLTCGSQNTCEKKPAPVCK